MDDDTIRQIARQLSRPSGEGGVQVTTAMNEANAFITARALEALSVRAGDHVLEIGPGNGRLSLPVVEALGASGRYLGFEYEDDIAAITRTVLAGECPIEVRTGDFMQHEPTAVSVDALLAVNVVYFMPDLGAFAARCHDWLRPGGRLVLGVRSLASLSAMPFAQHGFHLRPLDDLLRALNSAGFVSVSAAFHDEGMATLGELTLQADSIVVTASRAGADS